MWCLAQLYRIFPQSWDRLIEESHPEAYKLLSSFKPGAQKSHLRKILLKAMQIKAGLTLGLLATYVTAETMLSIENLKSRMQYFGAGR